MPVQPEVNLSGQPGSRLVNTSQDKQRAGLRLCERVREGAQIKNTVYNHNFENNLHATVQLHQNGRMVGMQGIA